MTLRHTIPVLDRAITVTRRVATDAAYRYGRSRGHISFVTQPGDYRLDGDFLALAETDSDGVTFPDAVAVGTVSGLTFGSGAAIDVTVVSFTIPNALSGIRQITFQPNVGVQTGELNISIAAAVTTDVETTAWAQRLDFRGRDSLQAGWVAERTRYIVRAEGPAGSLLIGDTFTDDGATWTIQGRSMIYGRAFVELLAEREGSN